MSKTSNENELYFPWGLKIFVGIIFIGFCCYFLAKGMPYLFDKKSIYIRFGIILPLIVGYFTYFIYFHKWKTTGLTGFQMRFSKKDLANPTFKIKKISSSFSLVLLFSASLAWGTWGTIACAAYIFSKHPIEKELIISGRSNDGRSGIDINLIDSLNRNEYSMLISVSKFYDRRENFQTGNTLCLKGRTSPLGMIIESYFVGKC